MRSLIVLDDATPTGARGPDDWVTISAHGDAAATVHELATFGAPSRESRSPYVSALDVPRWVLLVRMHVGATLPSERDAAERAAYARGVADEAWRAALFTVAESAPAGWAAWGSKLVTQWIAETLGFPLPRRTRR